MGLSVTEGQTIEKIKIEMKQLGRLGQLVGLCIGALLALAYDSYTRGDGIELTVYVGIALFFVMIVGIQVMYMMIFMVEKSEERKDQLNNTDIQNKRTEVEIRKYELQIELKQLEKAEV